MTSKIVFEPAKVGASSSNPLSDVVSNNAPYVLVRDTRMKVIEWNVNNVRTSVGVFSGLEVTKFWIGRDRDAYICPGSATFELSWHFITRFPVSGIITSANPQLTMRRKWRRMMRKGPNTIMQKTNMSDADLIKAAQGLYIDKKVGESDPIVVLNETTTEHPFEGSNLVCESIDTERVVEARQSAECLNYVTKARRLLKQCSDMSIHRINEMSEEELRKAMASEDLTISDYDEFYPSDQKTQIARTTRAAPPLEYHTLKLVDDLTGDETSLALLANLKVNVSERDKLINMLNFRVKLAHKRPEMSEKEWIKILPHFQWVWKSTNALYAFTTNSFKLIARVMKVTMTSLVTRLLAISQDDEKTKTTLRRLVEEEDELYGFTTKIQVKPKESR